MEKSGLNRPYLYNFVEVCENEFEFSTNKNLKYSVYFIPAKSQYFSEFPDLPDNIYLFGFNLLTKPLERLTFDANIEVTVITILKNFLNDHYRAVLFLCDLNENKQRHRKITFNRWFNKHNLSFNFEKNDREIIIDSENQYYISLILHCNNPDKEKFLNAFSENTDMLSNK